MTWTPGVSVVGGLRDLVLMTPPTPEFWGFARDEYTTLAETRDRMPRHVSGTHSGGSRSTSADWAASYRDGPAALLDAFVGTYSYSFAADALRDGGGRPRGGAGDL